MSAEDKAGAEDKVGSEDKAGPEGEAAGSLSATPETAAGTPEPAAGTPEPAAVSEPSRVAMDAACLRMAEASASLKGRCDEFEATLVASGRDLGAVRLASAAVRMVGMQSMGLTTAYLTELNHYMKALERMNALEAAE